MKDYVPSFNISFLCKMLLRKFKEVSFLNVDVKNPQTLIKKFLSNTSKSLNNILCISQQIFTLNCTRFKLTLNKLQNNFCKAIRHLVGGAGAKKIDEEKVCIGTFITIKFRYVNSVIYTALTIFCLFIRALQTTLWILLFLLLLALFLILEFFKHQLSDQ